MEIKEWIDLILSVATLAGLVIALYKFSRDPDEKADKKIGEMAVACKLKHELINQSIIGTQEDIKLIKTNHLAHIEKDMSEMQKEISNVKGDVQSILAILQDRQNRK